MSTTQRNATRNQSTADFVFLKMFIFENRFESGLYTQAASAPPNSGNLQTGMLVARDLTNPGQYIPVTSSNVANVIGVADVEGIVALGANATLQIAVCVKGDVDANLFVMPSGVTLDTTVGSKALRDVLEGMGLHLVNGSLEMTKADN